MQTAPYTPSIQPQLNFFKVCASNNSLSRRLPAGSPLPVASGPLIDLLEVTHRGGGGASPAWSSQQAAGGWIPSPQSRQERPCFLHYFQSLRNLKTWVFLLLPRPTSRQPAVAFGCGGCPPVRRPTPPPRAFLKEPRPPPPGGRQERPCPRILPLSGCQGPTAAQPGWCQRCLDWFPAYS